MCYVLLPGQPRFHPKLLEFTSYYSFLPGIRHRCRPQTKGNIYILDRLLRHSTAINIKG